MNEIDRKAWKAILIRLNRIARERPRNLKKLEQLLRRTPEILCPLAVEAALEDGEPMGAALAKILLKLQDPVLAGMIHELIPERTVTLALAGTIALQQTLTAKPKAGVDDLIEFGGQLNNLSVRHAELGEHRDGLLAARRAVAHFRWAARRDSATFRPYLAMVLTTLALRQGDCGLLKAGLASAKEAFAICSELARQQPVEFASELARALMTVANRHAALAQHEEALAQGRQATAIYRQLAKADPGFEGDLALGAFNIANRLTEIGREREAIEAGREAVKLFVRLERARPDAFEELSAAALNTLAVNLSSCGEIREAHDYAMEAVSRFRVLDRRQPTRFRVDLVTCLGTLAECQTHLGRLPEAIRTSQEAVSLASQWHSGSGPGAELHLAAALTNLCHRYLQVGQTTEATRIGTMAVRVGRRAAGSASNRKSILCNTLIHQAESLRRAGQIKRALSTAREAVALAKGLVRRHFLAYGPKLGTALGTLASCEAAMSQHRKALRHQLERVAISRRLCQEDLSLHDAELAIGLANLARRYLDVGNVSAAEKAIAEALSLFKRLTTRRPAYVPALRTAENTAATVAAIQGGRDSRPPAENAGSHLTEISF